MIIKKNTKNLEFFNFHNIRYDEAISKLIS